MWSGRLHDPEWLGVGQVYLPDRYRKLVDLRGITPDPQTASIAEGQEK
jgi:hypothetical protein